jgi:hypothetical protein
MILKHSLPSSHRYINPINSKSIIKMYPFHDSWYGSSYVRRLEGSTLKITLSPTPSQLQRAMLELNTYTSFFSQPAPILIGRGCHNTWRPEGYMARGTRPVYALEVFSEIGRDAFRQMMGVQPHTMQGLPGEVIVYGEGEMAVCLDGTETAVPLNVFSATDGVMTDFPSWVPRTTLVSDQCGFNVLVPIWGLVTTLGIWTRMRQDLMGLVNTPNSPVEWRTELQMRVQGVEEDIHDFLYLCYSQAKLNHIKCTISLDDPRMVSTRNNITAYLRSFAANDVYAEARRNTATDHFVEIGLFSGLVLGPQYDMYGQAGWNNVA